MKQRSLKEAVGYTPEKINEFVAKATKDVQDLQKVFRLLRNRVENLTIKEVEESPNEATKLQEKVKVASKYASDKHDFYFEVGEGLEELTEKLDDLQQNLKYVGYAMDNLVEAANDFSKFYGEEDEEF